MKKLDAKASRRRNWEILRLRGAYRVLVDHYASLAARAEVDRALKVLGAESETERNYRLFHEHLDKRKNLCHSSNTAT
jgi:hypothetical protein